MHFSRLNVRKGVWLRESKSQYESALTGLSVLWPFGIAEGVLSALDGLPETG